MSRSPYYPPIASVSETVPERAARWKWLCVPFGHAALTLALLISWWWLEPRPADAPAANLTLEANWVGGMVIEALFQGGVLFVATILMLWALPRIYLRHVAYVSIVSGAAGYIAAWVTYFIRGPHTTNGEHLDRIVVTYGVVLLLSSVVIGARAKLPPNKSLERTREG
jgi:hypothetical protein